MPLPVLVYSKATKPPPALHPITGRLNRFCSPVAATVFFLVAFSSAFGQKTGNFYAIDSFASTVQYKRDIYRLTKELTDRYDNELDKTRSIFRWITLNIAYDYKFYNTGKEVKAPPCKPGTDCEEHYRNWEKRHIEKVLKKKKGICSGYSMLFKKMCDIAGIRSEIISGYTRTKPYQIGNAGAVNHAWNAVWIGDRWFFLDATWAAGYCYVDEGSGKLVEFVRSYSDYYWFTSFHNLSRNHYPKEGKWVFESNYTKEKFAANPYYDPDVLPSIDLLSPASGIIEAKKGDTIRFRFRYTSGIQQLQVNSNYFRNPDIWKKEKIRKRWYRRVVDTLAMKKQQYIPFRQNEGLYEFEYVVPSSIFYIEVLFDYRLALRFRVKMIDDN